MSKLTTPPTMSIFKYLLNNGIAIVIVVFFLVLGKQYFELRMDQLSKEFETKINTMGYSVHGEIIGVPEGNAKPIQIDLQLTELRVKE